MDQHAMGDGDHDAAAGQLVGIDVQAVSTERGLQTVCGQGRSNASGLSTAPERPRL
ncbi:hypothetical protein GCM10018953_59350 [Streptosporangium nondiastaticum]